MAVNMAVGSATVVDNMEPYITREYESTITTFL
jgi:hypothetical protein